MSILTNVAFPILLIQFVNADKLPEDKCRVKADLSICYSTNKSYHDNQVVDCNGTSDSICEKFFNVSYIRMEPYNINILEFVFKMCCGGCNRFNVTNTFEHIWQVTPKIMQDTQLVFPVLGPSVATRMHGYHFLPLLEAPFVYYITERRIDTITSHFMHSCLGMWPVILICLMFAAIAGFVCWISETWTNQEHFPRSFLIGWFEGFWWGFISMTTVGYGDKVPTTLGARLFSVVWILTGIISFSALTATFANQMYKANNPRVPSMAGKKVGAMRHRVFEGAVIARGGGILVDVEMSNDTDTVFQLISLLRNKKIDGFILDRYTFVTLCTFMESDLQTHHKLADDISYMMKKTIHTEEEYNGQSLSFGMLVRDVEDYRFFFDFIRGSEVLINVCCALAINDVHVKRGVHVSSPKEDKLFSMDSGLFWPTFIAASVILVAICCFGFGLELWTRKSSRNKGAFRGVQM